MPPRPLGVSGIGRSVWEDVPPAVQPEIIVAVIGFSPPAWFDTILSHFFIIERNRKTSSWLAWNAHVSPREIASFFVFVSVLATHAAVEPRQMVFNLENKHNIVYKCLYIFFVQPVRAILFVCVRYVGPPTTRGRRPSVN